MTVTAHINIDTPAGRRFVREMAKYVCFLKQNEFSIC